MAGIHLKIDPHRMISVANIIQAETARIKQHYNSIESHTRNIRNDWEGGGAETFFRLMEQLNEQTRIITSRLDKNHSDLTAIANEFIKQEGLAEQQVQALSTDIFNI